MEARLLEFITSVQTLSDIRNLDKFNPIIFELEHPLTATRYQVAGSKVEPSFLGFPINGTWVVLDSMSPYYLKALKLQDVRNPDTVTTLPAVLDGTAWWHVIRTYDEIFSDPQYYNVGKTMKGEKGDIGPMGPPGKDGTQGVDGKEGPAGPAPDINTVITAALLRMKSYAGTLTINGPSSCGNNATADYTVSLTCVELEADGTTSTVTTNVPAQVVVKGTNNHAYVDARNTLHVSGVSSGAEVIALEAIWPSWGEVLIAEKPVSLASAAPVSLAINAAAFVYAGKTTPLTATVTFSDNTTAVVTPTYSVDVGATVAGSVLTALSPISANINAVISATITLGGVKLDATKPITIRQVVATGLSIAGAASIPESTTSAYTATVTFNSGDTATVTPVWSTSDATKGSVSATGILSAGAVTADTTVTLTAKYTAPSSTTEVTATKDVAITNVVAAMQSYYGVGPALPADWQAFVTALANRGTSGDLTADFSIDMIGSTTFGYYAYPVSYGQAQFFDPLSNFTGGWGGAGNSKGGTSAASAAAGVDTPLTQNITVNGVSTPFYIYRTDNANMGAAASNRWVVQHKA